MGTISQRKNKDGVARYRAEIRITKEGMAKFSESKTFSKKSLADAWIKKREAEIELNPQLLHKSAVKSMRVSDAVAKYLAETEGRFARTWVSNLKLIASTPFGAKYLDKLGRDDFMKFAHARLNGTYPNLKPILPQTLTHDIVLIRALLTHAENVWGVAVKLDDFEKVVRGLKFARQIKHSDKRYRLPTNAELQQLTNYFYRSFMRRDTGTPLHLLMWFAIETARRQEEICRLRLDDYHDGWWTVRNAKNPNGSHGNHKIFKVNATAQRIMQMFMDTDLRDIQKRQFKAFDDRLLFSGKPKNLSARFTETCKILGIEDLHFHDLRHEAATRLAEQGLTIPQIQQVTCHDSWSSLQRYVNNKKPRPTVLEFDEAMRVAKADFDG